MIYPLGGMSRVGFFLPLRAMAAKAHVEIARVYQNYHSIVAVEGVSKCDFAMSRDVACRVSMFATTYKTFNINSLSSQIVETQNFASLLPH